jgi:hypothetical protein
MVRSHWMVPAALVLASAGLARGQGSPAELGADARKDRFVTIQEVGRPPLRCKLVKSWYEADGSRSLQVRAVDTGEMISIFQSGPHGFTPGDEKSKPLASRIVHWGPASHPPAGTPDAPPDATVYGAQAAASAAGSTEPRKPTDASQPYAAKPPAGGWPTAYARQTPAIMPPKPTTPSVTAPKPTTPTVQLAQSTPLAQPSAPRIIEEKSETKSPVAAKAPPATVAPAPIETKPLPTVAVKATPPPAPPLPEKPAPVVPEAPAVSKWNPVPVPLPTVQHSPQGVLAPPPAPSSKVESTVTVKTADARKPADEDWHQSWGKVEQPKSALLASAVPPSPAPVKVDPLMDPESFSRATTDMLINRKYKEKGIKDATKSDSAAATAKNAEPPSSVVKAVEAKQPVAEPPTKQAEPTPPPPFIPSVQSSSIMQATPPPAATATTTPAPAFIPPPPPIPANPVKSMPAYISAASAAAADDGGNAFSSPRPAPKSNAGSLNTQPPPVSMMPGYTGATGSEGKWLQIPAAPPVIAAAPSASVVAAGFPVAAQPARAPAAAEGVPLEAGLSASELLMTLQTSLYPSQREWAVDRLTACDWHADSRIVDGLVKSARTDPAPLVRAGCLRALARMRAASEVTLAAARELKADTDARVRQEAETTLGALQTAARPVRLSD